MLRNTLRLVQFQSEVQAFKNKNSMEKEKQTGFIRFINELGQVIIKETLDKMIKEEQDLSFSRLEVD